jgi:hypothetical protein
MYSVPPLYPPYILTSRSRTGTPPRGWKCFETPQPLGAGWLTLQSSSNLLVPTPIFICFVSFRFVSIFVMTRREFPHRHLPAHLTPDSLPLKRLTPTTHHLRPRPTSVHASQPTSVHALPLNSQAARQPGPTCLEQRITRKGAAAQGASTSEPSVW